MVHPVHVTCVTNRVPAPWHPNEIIPVVVPRRAGETFSASADETRWKYFWRRDFSLLITRSVKNTVRRARGVRAVIVMITVTVLWPRAATFAVARDFIEFGSYQRFRSRAGVLLWCASRTRVGARAVCHRSRTNSAPSPHAPATINLFFSGSRQSRISHTGHVGERRGLDIESSRVPGGIFQVFCRFSLYEKSWPKVQTAVCFSKKSTTILVHQSYTIF